MGKSKVVRIDTATETNNERVRLVFRSDNENQEYDLLWDFMIKNPYATKNFFHSLNVVFCGQIAQAMINLNPEHCVKILATYKAYMQEVQDQDRFERYSALKSEWSRLTMLIQERLEFCRDVLATGSQDQEVLDMLSDLKFYFMTAPPIAVYGLCDQLKMCGVDLKAAS